MLSSEIFTVKIARRGLASKSLIPSCPSFEVLVDSPKPGKKSLAVQTSLANLMLPLCFFLPLGKDPST
jgi:hypothetical protein